ncbi:MAG: peptide deformylase [Candidatus Omnitrophica bacterium]|nr:peptide deformylase [Candidatus Omnitrophota bacterium]
MKQTLKVLIYPDPMLKKKALPVENIGSSEIDLIRKMVKTMYVEGGVGLAAPQVGALKRILIASPEAKPGGEIVLINPIILKTSGEHVGPEGCLSLPGISGDVRRAKKIEYAYLDIEGKQQEKQATDFLARIIQHELDHLDGKLLIDRVDFDQRQEILSTYQRL